MAGETTVPGTTSAPSAQDRRHFLGASDVAAVLGLSPYRSPREVWSEKVAGEVGPALDNDDVARGLAMEPVIDTMVRRRGIVLEPGGEFAVQGSCIVVHPDRLAPDGVWELKAPRRWGRQWGEEGTDEVPELYLVQILVQMLAVRAAGRSVEHSHIAAMCGELRTYPIPFHLDTARGIVDYCDKWWDKHVIHGDEPPAHSMVELQQIAARKPMMVVPSDLAERIRRIKMARKIKAAVEKIEEEDKRFVLAALSKDGALPEAIECDGVKVADIRRGGRKQLDQESLRAADPVLFEAHCKRIEWNELRPTKNLPLMPIQDVVQIEQDQ